MRLSNSAESKLVSEKTSTTRFVGYLTRIAIPVVILAVGVASFAMLAVELEEEKSPPVPLQVIQTRVKELQVLDYDVVVRTHGTVQAHNEVRLSAEVSGQIVRVASNFEVGSYFSQGDVLVEIDPRDYKTIEKVAKAQQLGAKAAVQLAIQDQERKLKLSERIAVSDAEVNQATAIRLQAEAQLDAAIARVEQAKRDLERTKIRAPFDGRVRRKTVGLGQTIDQGAPLGEVFAIDYAEVRLPIAARELRFLNLPEMAIDPPIDVLLHDGITEDTTLSWQAKIVRTEGTLDENSLELFAIARVKDPFGHRSRQPSLRIGQPVTATIKGKVLNDVIAIPRAAVRQLDQIFIVNKVDLTLMCVTINPLWSDEKHIIVRHALLQNGDLLSTTRLVYAPDGTQVEIIPDSGIATATTQAEPESVTN